MSEAPAVAASDSSQPSPREPNWRKEVISRVQLHRARRGRRGDADAAMEFDFGPEEALAVTEEPVVRARVPRFTAPTSFLPAIETDAARNETSELVIAETPKIIRFPRQPASALSNPIAEWEAPPDVLEPLPEMPARILDQAEADLACSGPELELPSEASQASHVAPSPLPEQMELLASFDDIRLEEGHVRAAIASEVIPRPASLQQRFFAGVVDAGAVVLAAVIFAVTFIQLAEDDPHSRLALLFAVCVSAALWILFQYLFLVHGSGTPGMRLAQLELATFEGRPVGAYARRWRALASTLSALSVGLGYAWALVDEDQLGWHDRITGTLVRSAHERSDEEPELWD